MNAPMHSTPRVLPFFFDAEPGTRFSLYHAPSPHVPARGAILYVHPFAEELNHSRRMAALQSRRFAAMGFAVLQIDLFGCGDSCGDFNTARWDLWKRDLAIARDWLAERSAGPLYLWGLRLGALLALDFAAASHADGIIMWQPFLNGHTCLNQFLRQRDSSRRAGALRSQLLARGAIEVAGYELALPLAQAIDACDAATLPLPACPVHWLASGEPAPRRLAASAARLQQRWAARGVRLYFHPIQGLPFWLGGVAECPALLDATCAILAPEEP
ncbi:hydrolase 2, exosortase A system-associated [Massilia sp. PAMC28688]|uniref:hydrolase 2, exosortase A system-associated n=1 Tax=Massilia sp. PAMC28688 TaxID=2861283 RepID=UPI001C637692|nr:hydrolase 2, exosortase A system-associated [Massilia sp. PAMC28688]QYF92958.1 hydrolase 2, exosortase A system-associated [Massilia sp. PAMC28688]